MKLLDWAWVTLWSACLLIVGMDLSDRIFVTWINLAIEVSCGVMFWPVLRQIGKMGEMIGAEIVGPKAPELKRLLEKMENDPVLNTLLDEFMVTLLLAGIFWMCWAFWSIFFGIMIYTSGLVLLLVGTKIRRHWTDCYVNPYLNS